MFHPFYPFSQYVLSKASPIVIFIKVDKFQKAQNLNEPPTNDDCRAEVTLAKEERMGRRISTGITPLGSISLDRILTHHFPKMTV